MLAEKARIVEAMKEVESEFKAINQRYGFTLIRNFDMDAESPLFIIVLYNGTRLKVPFEEARERMEEYLRTHSEEVEGMREAAAPTDAETEKPLPVEEGPPVSEGVQGAEETSEEQGVRQMKAAKAAEDLLRQNFADFVITPMNHMKEVEKARIDHGIKQHYKKVSNHRSSVVLNGYVYNSGQSEKQFKDSLRAAIEKAINAMVSSSYRNKSPMAIAFVPADKYELAQAVLAVMLRTEQNADKKEMLRRVRIVGETNIPEDGLVNELHHADLGREFLNYDRLIDGKTKAERVDQRELERRTAASIIEHIRTLTVDPQAEILSTDKNPTEVIEDFLKGEVFLPELGKMDFNTWRDVHEALLAIRTSL